MAKPSSWDSLVHYEPPQLELRDMKTWSPARVSWASVGSVSPQDATAFALEVMKKANKAKQVNQRVDELVRRSHCPNVVLPGHKCERCGARKE